MYLRSHVGIGKIKGLFSDIMSRAYWPNLTLLHIEDKLGNQAINELAKIWMPQIKKLILCNNYTLAKGLIKQMQKG